MTQKLVVPITFQIYQGDNLIRTETIAQSVIKIGRDQKSHLRLDDESVSRMHAVIEAKPEEVQLIDLGSGTFVNGSQVNKCALAGGEEIRIGNTRLVIAIGEAVDPATIQAAAAPVAAAPVAAPVASVPPPAAMAAPFAAPLAAPFGAPAPASHGHGSHGAHDAGHGHAGGEEIFQLIKRGDINPHDVEEVGSQAVEVSILWKNSILHVAHLDGTKDFVLASERPKKGSAGIAMGAGLGLGAAVMIAGAAMAGAQVHPQPHDTSTVAEVARAAINRGYMVGMVGVALSFIGTGIGIALDSKDHKKRGDTARFVASPEMMGNASETMIVQNSGGGTRFVFLPGATGEVELDGVKKTLKELVDAGQVRASAGGGYEIDVRPNGRYKMEAGGLTVLAKVVAPGRKIVGATKRDPVMIGAAAASFVLIFGFILGMRLAISDDGGLLSQGNDEDRLNDLRAFIQRQQERQPETPPPQDNANNEQEGGQGTRHAGPEGKMGKRDAPSRSARYAIRNNGEPPHMSRQAARDAIQQRGIFAALGAPGGGAAGGASGIVSPFGGLTESGLDNVNANGNMTGDAIGDAFGFGGLGATGTGWGGGGTGEGTIGLGNFGTMGHGSGTGTGQGYGSGAGSGLRGRSNRGPTVRAAPPQVTGLLSPEAIRRVVLRNLGQVAHCHEQGLAQNPTLEGRVVVRFIIGGTGTVMGSTVQESNVAVPSVSTCIANAVRRWQFPSPEGGGVVTVNYPFNLQRPE
ncbi:MAG: AgmX/PglI C-terminal domain-containing protein [Myxococcales bacterium]|nr:AgmX/PglI C-terminal domain-containing protein [Myxococcales bacterium]